MKLLKDLKAGDIFFLVYSDNGYNEWISSVTKCKVKDILEIKIGRIIHYVQVDDEYKDVYGLTVQYKDYGNVTCSASGGSICADKEYMMEILEAERDNFKYHINSIIDRIK